MHSLVYVFFGSKQKSHYKRERQLPCMDRVTKENHENEFTSTNTADRSVAKIIPSALGILFQYEFHCAAYRGTPGIGDSTYFPLTVDLVQSEETHTDVV
jgi:hypothetical protein